MCTLHAHGFDPRLVPAHVAHARQPSQVGSRLIDAASSTDRIHAAGGVGVVGVVGVGGVVGVVGVVGVAGVVGGVGGVGSGSCLSVISR